MLVKLSGIYTIQSPEHPEKAPLSCSVPSGNVERNNRRDIVLVDYFF